MRRETDGVRRTSGHDEETRLLTSSLSTVPPDDTPLADPSTRGSTKRPRHERLQGGTPAAIIARASPSTARRPLSSRAPGFNGGGGGVTLSFAGVTILHRPFHEFYRKPSVVVQDAMGVFPGGGLHVVSGQNSVSINALLAALAGTTAPAAGTILANSVPVQAMTFRRAVGYVSRELLAATEVFTTEKNVRFALRMRTVLRAEEAAAAVRQVLSIVDLLPDLVVAQLTRMQRLKLHIAMELATNPPALLIEQPLDNLDCHQHFEISELLHRIAVDLRKTVMLSTTSIPLPLFERVHSIVLLGAGGHLVFSGRAALLPSYFAWLRLPITMLDSPRPGDDYPHADAAHSGAYRSRFSTFPLTAPTFANHSAHPQSAAGDESFSRQGTSTIGAERSPDGDFLAIDSGEAALDVMRLWEHEDAAQRGGTAGRNPHTMRHAARFHDSEFCARLRQEQNTLLMSTSPFQQQQQQQGDDAAVIVVPAGTAEDARAGVPVPLHSPSTLLPTSAHLAPREQPPTLVKVAALLRFRLEQSLRQRDFYIVSVLLFCVLGFSSWVASEQTLDQRGMQNIRGVIFFLFLVMFETNVMLLPSMIDDATVFPHQRDSGYYNAFTGLFVFVVRVMLSRIVFIAATAVFIQLVLTGMDDLLILLGVTNFTHACLLYVVVLVTLSQRAATFAAYCLEAYSVVFSGFLINMASLPGSIAKTSLMRYGYGAAVANVLRGKPFSCDAPFAPQHNGTTTPLPPLPPLPDNTTSYCYTGDKYLQLEGFEDDDTATNSAQLLTIAAALLLMALLRMHLMRR